MVRHPTKRAWAGSTFRAGSPAGAHAQGGFRGGAGACCGSLRPKLFALKPLPTGSRSVEQQISDLGGRFISIHARQVADPGHRVCRARWMAAAVAMGLGSACPSPPGEQWILVAPADVGMDAALLNRSVSELPDPRRMGWRACWCCGMASRCWNGIGTVTTRTAHDLRSATKEHHLAAGRHRVGQPNAEQRERADQRLPERGLPGAPALKRASRSSIC